MRRRRADLADNPADDGCDTSAGDLASKQKARVEACSSAVGPALAAAESRTSEVRR